MDIDNDLDKDLFVSSDSLYFYQNIGNPYNPIFNNAVSNPYGNISDSISIINFYDFDNDNDYDIIGSKGPFDFVYLENTGSFENPDYSKIRYFPIVNDPLYYGDLRRFKMIDIDNDNDADIIASGLRSFCFYFENSGTASLPSYEEGVLRPFGLIYGWGGGDISSSDLDKDGDIDIIMINYIGASTSVSLYKNELITSNIDDLNTQTNLKIYPTIVDDHIFIDNSDFYESIEIFTLSGTKKSEFKKTVCNSYDLSFLENGIYILKVNYNNANYSTLKFYKQ